jgi:hypothetical protein
MKCLVVIAKSHSKEVGALQTARIILLTIKRARGYMRRSSSTEAHDADDEDLHH